MLDNSSVDYVSEYFNRTIVIETPLTNEQKSDSISKIELLLENLKKAQQINLSMQSDLIDIITESQNKMTKIELMLQKINNIKKSKPKKHMRYPNYIPLDSFYFYTSKRIHLYYHLLEKVFESNKKDLDKDEIKVKMNRYNFTKVYDNILNQIIFINEKNNIINWYIVSAEMNKILNNNNNNNIIVKEDESLIKKKKKKNKEINNNNNNITIFTPLICYVRYLEISSFYKYKKWNDEEDKILRKAILYYGPKNWQQISYCLDGRNNSQCFHRWMKGINPKIKRDKWSFIEDLILGLTLNKIYKKKKWSKIAYHLLGRTDIQCRERWCNILDPSLEDVEWTNEEDIKLLNLYREHGNKWSLIAKYYGNRTDNTCWRRWKYLTSLNISKSNNNDIIYNDISGMSMFNMNESNGIDANGKKLLFKVVNLGKK
jgi:hypothetical protein